MKKTIFTLSTLLLFSSSILFANSQQSADYKKTVQQEIENLGGHFLDSVFQPGQIIFNDGTISEQELNFYLNSKRICYINEKGEPFVLTDLSTVEKVSYGDRTFIPTGKSDCAELIETFSDGSMLLAERQAIISALDDNIALYGGPAITTSSTRLSTMPAWGEFDPLEIDDLYTPNIIENFVLMKNGKRCKISKLKSLKKFFRSNWSEIEEYASQHCPDIHKQEDLVDLLEFATK